VKTEEKVLGPDTLYSSRNLKVESFYYIGSPFPLCFIIGTSFDGTEVFFSLYFRHLREDYEKLASSLRGTDFLKKFLKFLEERKKDFIAVSYSRDREKLRELEMKFGPFRFGDGITNLLKSLLKGGTK